MRAATVGRLGGPQAPHHGGGGSCHQMRYSLGGVSNAVLKGQQTAKLHRQKVSSSRKVCIPFMLCLFFPFEGMACFLTRHFFTCSEHRLLCSFATTQIRLLILFCCSFSKLILTHWYTHQFGIVEGLDQSYPHPRIKHPETAMFRLGISTPTACIAGGLSVKELYIELSYLTIQIHDMAVLMYEGHTHTHICRGHQIIASHLSLKIMLPSEPKVRNWCPLLDGPKDIETDACY